MGRLLAIVAILVALALVGFSLFGPKTRNPRPTAQNETSFTLTEYAISPERVTIQAGRVKLTFTNKGKILHQIEIYDTVEQRMIFQSDMIRQNDTKVVWVDLVGGRRYEVYDPVWRNRGMEGLIITR
jgi:plastocyanin